MSLPWRVPFTKLFLSFQGGPRILSAGFLSIYPFGVLRWLNNNFNYNCSFIHFKSLSLYIHPNLALNEIIITKCNFWDSDEEKKIILKANMATKSIRLREKWSYKSGLFLSGKSKRLVLVESLRSLQDTWARWTLLIGYSKNKHTESKI